MSAIESACLDRVSIPANFCPIFVAFFESEIKSAIDQSFQPPPTNVKRLELIQFHGVVIFNRCSKCCDRLRI